MRATSIPISRTTLRSKRLLAMRGDEHLVDALRLGDELAFEVAFERHGPAILSFCRHMLGSAEEAEDAVQQTFASAYRSLLGDERDIRLKPWLFTIARNRCLSMLRARREQPVDQVEVPTAGLAEAVERRAELRELLADLRDLPQEQRAALLLAEASDLSHAEIADVLGCEVPRVKALVFRARSGLIERREARDTPCERIREQLAVVTGGSLRRGELRHHLRVCPGCSEFREQVKAQRRMLGAALPVAPSMGLKSSVLAALGFGGGGAGGGGAAAGGMGAAAVASVGTSTVAKLAVVGVLVGGGAYAGEAVQSHAPSGSGPDAPVASRPLASEARAAAPPGSGKPRAKRSETVAAKDRTAPAGRKRSKSAKRGKKGSAAGRSRADEVKSRSRSKHAPPGGARKVAEQRAISRARAGSPSRSKQSLPAPRSDTAPTSVSERVRAAPKPRAIARGKRAVELE